MPRLYELLETKNRKEQEKRVARLIQAATAVLPEIIVRLDTRSGRISVIPIDIELTVDQVLALLDAARSFVVQQERQAMSEQQPQTNPPGVPRAPDKEQTDEPARGNDEIE